MLGRLPADASREGQPKNGRHGGPTEGGRTSPQPKDLVIPTIQESDKRHVSFRASTIQPSPNLPGVATKEDSADLPHPTRGRVLGELISEKPVTNSRSPTDVVASTPEEEGKYVVSVDGNSLTLLQRRRRIQNPGPCQRDNRNISTRAVSSKETEIPHNLTIQRNPPPGNRTSNIFPFMPSQSGHYPTSLELQHRRTLSIPISCIPPVRWFWENLSPRNSSPTPDFLLMWWPALSGKRVSASCP